MIWPDAADAYYLEQAKDIGFAGGESMDELLLHDSRSVDIDGDVGYVLTSDEFGQPKLQIIEGHRITKGDRKERDAFICLVSFVDSGHFVPGFTISRSGNARSQAQP